MPDLTLKNYVVIGVIVGVIFFFIAQLAGEPIANYLAQLRIEAVAIGVPDFFAAMVAEPWRFLLGQPIIGALIAAALWPIILIWFFLGFVLMVWELIASALAYSRSGISQGQ